MLVSPGYDDDHESFRDSVAKFLASEAAPSLEEWRSIGLVPQEFFLAAGEQGLTGVAVPEEFGGGGVADPRFRAVVVQETMQIGAFGLALLLANHVGACIPAMLRHDLVDSEPWLPGVASGEVLAVPVVLSGSLRAAAVPGALVAGLFVVCEVGQDGESTIRLVPRAECVVSESERWLGGCEAGVADVTFEGSALETRLSSPGGEFLRELDLWSAVLAVAGSRQALTLTLDYVNERRVFGRRVASFENTRFRLAELASAMCVAEAFVESCISTESEGALSAEGAAAARLAAGRVHDDMVDQGIQLHGGYGYMREYAIANAFGDSRFLRLVAARNGEPRELIARALGM